MDYEKPCIIVRLFLISLILLQIAYPSYAANMESNIQDSEGLPSYYLIARTSETQVEKGDSFKIDIYVSGEGAVNDSRISVHIPRYIVKNERIVYGYLKYRLIDPINNTWHPYVVTINQSPSFFDRIDPIFYEKPIEQGYMIGATAELADVYGSNIGAYENYFDGKYHSPRSIEFSISKNAPSGDHEITIYYFYRYLNKWYQDKQVITLHVNEWYENDFYQSILRLAAVIALLVAIGELIVLSKKLYDYIANRVRS